MRCWLTGFAVHSFLSTKGTLISVHSNLVAGIFQKLLPVTCIVIEMRNEQLLLLCLSVFVLVLNCLTAPADWKCGTTGMEDLSFNIVQLECPAARPGIGFCCQTHDSESSPVSFYCCISPGCYDLQLGRERCDNEFCSCMSSTMNVMNCRGATVQNFCSLVKFNGGLAYTLAGIKHRGG